MKNRLAAGPNSTSTVSATAAFVFALFLATGSAQAQQTGSDRNDNNGGDSGSNFGFRINLNDLINSVDRNKNRNRTRKRRRNTPARNTQNSPSTVPQFATRELLIIVDSNTDDATVDALLQDYGLTRIAESVIALIGQRIIRSRVGPPLSPQRTLQLSIDPRITFAQPNYLYTLSARKAAQYAVAKLGLEDVHSLSRGDGIIVGILDTGVNRAHPSLKGVVQDQEDFTGRKRNARESHGTAVASVIAARDGMIGVAPGAKVLSARVFARSKKYRQSLGHTFNLLRGVDWAVAGGAQVINMSFAGPADPIFQTMLKSASDAGVVVVAAAGNHGAKGPPAYPGAYDSVIAVTATDARDRLYKHANRGEYISLSAPGVNILAAHRSRSYETSSGTSMAAAYVTGAVALLRQSMPWLHPEDVVNRFTRTAVDLGQDGWDPLFGHGLLDIRRAFNEP